MSVKCISPGHVSHQFNPHSVSFHIRSRRETHGQSSVVLCLRKFREFKVWRTQLSNVAITWWGVNVADAVVHWRTAMALDIKKHTTRAQSRKIPGAARVHGSLITSQNSSCISFQRPDPEPISIMNSALHKKNNIWCEQRKPWMRHEFNLSKNVARQTIQMVKNPDR